MNTFFDGVRHLYGEAAFLRFQQAHVCVTGIGGVGSWAAEALARSGIGRLTLIDPDRVAPSNVNRQILALENTLGLPKVDVLAERIGKINPFCCVLGKAVKVTPENAAVLFSQSAFDYVIDAIDDVFAKAALIVCCHEKGIPLITAGGAGGQMDPTKITVRDLSKTEQEPLLARVRRRLRQQYGFSRGTKPFGVDAVYSAEPLRYPENRARQPEAAVQEGMEARPPRFGTSVTVTACFGMTAASVVLQRLADSVSGRSKAN
ncbi:MAG: tRNA threonylcarbamoyladenosine dehydratase [Oxalobacter formigenes]|nr:tRNA threonylcarbamoyladenosine dehydratase [Oxalobacter formigenes]